MNAALAGTDPVVCFDGQRLYDMGEMFEADGVPEGYHEIDLSQPSRKRAGGDLTMVTFGPALYTALEAADRLAADFHLESDVIDLRSANPIDYKMLLESVHRTGKVLLVLEAVERGSVMQTVASTITQLGFDDLDGPPVVVGRAELGSRPRRRSRRCSIRRARGCVTRFTRRSCRCTDMRPQPTTRGPSQCGGRASASSALVPSPDAKPARAT
jgi:pyruvate/2-oxoglutarate/acetoin dehydrogenase E1 component